MRFSKFITPSAVVTSVILLAGCERPRPTAPESRLPTSNADVAVADFTRQGPACVVLVGTDCPISNAYAPELRRIADAYRPQGVSFFAVYALRDVTQQLAEKHAREFGWDFPVLVDTDLRLARHLAAERMPEAVLLSAEGKVVYQGRIDDRYPAVGAKRREIPTRHDLRLALDALLAGQPIEIPKTDAVGCHLDFDPR
jgi:thiol-disulfide isomerase/thioredoxin